MAGSVGVALTLIMQLVLLTEIENLKRLPFRGQRNTHNMEGHVVSGEGGEDRGERRKGRGWWEGEGGDSGRVKVERVRG